MTAQDHNKFIGSLFLLLGGVSILLLIPAALLMLRQIGEMQKMMKDFKDASFEQMNNQLSLLFVIAIVVGVFILVAAILQITAGYGMLKHKPWARPAATIAAIAAIISFISFPIGTALGIYALWFLFGDKAKEFYGQSLTTAPPQPPKF